MIKDFMQWLLGQDVSGKIWVSSSFDDWRQTILINHSCSLMTVRAMLLLTWFRMVVGCPK